MFPHTKTSAHRQPGNSYGRQGAGFKTEDRGPGLPGLVASVRSGERDMKYARCTTFNQIYGGRYKRGTGDKYTLLLVMHVAGLL